MKASELRIGNYIWLESKQKEYQISSGHDIEEIDDAPLNFDAKPIQLTEEWLVKFGFSHISKNDYQSPYKFLIFDIKLLCFADIQDNNERIFSPIDVKYVHQLQNLYFSLTGEELEIK